MTYPPVKLPPSANRYGNPTVFNEQFAGMGDLFTVGDLNERLADLATVVIPVR